MANELPTVYFSLQTQFENLGDCIINELVIRELANHARVKVVQSRAPAWLTSRLQTIPGVEVYNAKRPWFSDLFKQLTFRSPVVFAFKPGHYITSNRLKSIAYSAALVAFCGACRFQGARVIRSGVSLDRFGTIQSWLQSLLGRLHSSYGVRDQASLDYARQLGATGAHYSPDMAFLLLGARETTGLDLNKPLTTPRPRTKLSLSFRQQGSLKDSECLEQLIKTAKECARQNSIEPVVVEQVTFDRELAARLAEGLSCPVIRFEQTEESVQSIFANYADSRVVISNRLHSLLFGWTSGAIPIPLVDNTPHSKIIELFKHLGLAELIHFTEDLGHLSEHIDKILRDELSWRKKLERVFKDQRVILQEALSGAFQSSRATADESLVQP